MAETEETKEGLELLDDEELAQIVKSDLAQHQKLCSHEAIVAFGILEERTS